MACPYGGFHLLERPKQNTAIVHSLTNITLKIIFFSLYQCYFHFRFTFTLHDLLFIVGEPLVHHFADTGVQTLQLLVF